MSFETRQRIAELMDQPGLDPNEHHAALDGLRRVNVLSRTASVLWSHITKSLDTSKPLRVLDVACGGGDVTIGLAQRAARDASPVTVSGCDISSVALERAATKARRAGVSVEWQRRNILTDGVPAECDVVCCSLFLHHLSDAEALALLTALGESRVRLVLISDLVRSRWNYWLTWIGTRLLSRSHIVHFDGPVSIRAAFTPDEARQLAQQAGLVGARAISHWPARFLLCWKRPE